MFFRMLVSYTKKNKEMINEMLGNYICVIFGDVLILIELLSGPQ